MSKRTIILALTALAVLAACDVSRTEEMSSATTTAAGDIRHLSIPPDSAIPAGMLGESIRRGRALLSATGDSLPDNVGNALRCTSCHLDEGTRINAAPLVGVYARFPQYRERSNSIALIEDRVNDCFQRSMNGRALAYDSQEMKDIVAWLAFLSRGLPLQRDTTPHGIPLLAAMTPDTAAGRALFATRCAQCHAMDGQGTLAGPPLWGPKSFNVGASMARLRTAASFIKYNMPFDRPGVLTEQQSFDLAAYINGHSRPDFAGKEHDWPKGNAPDDAPYETIGKRQRHQTSDVRRQMSDSSALRSNRAESEI
jgi:thiosulfate dehydrogenase